MLKRWLKLLFKAWLLLILLLVVFLVFERVRGQISLAHFKRQLIAKGETLDIQKLIPPPPADADNGAADILRLKTLLQDPHDRTDHLPPKMKFMAPGKAMVGFRENYWIDETTTNTWEDLSAELATNEPVLEELQAALARPVFDFKLDHSDGFKKMQFTHLAPVKKISEWLGVAAQNSLRAGNSQTALRHLVAAVTLPKILENDHIVISELVRCAISSINLGTTWEALQADIWTDEQLAILQSAWEKNTFITNMAHAFEIERADADTEYKRYQTSNDETYEEIFPAWPQFVDLDDESKPCHWWEKEFVRKQIYCRVWRFAWLYQDERLYLAGMDQLIHDQRTGAEKYAHPVTSLWLDFPLDQEPHQNFYNNLRYGTATRTLGTLSFSPVRAARVETERSLVLCAIALKRYQLRQGQIPPDLNSLVPDFLPSVPIDPMDGRPMKYRANADGTYVLYSVGTDGRDDNGDPSPIDSEQSHRLLWNDRDAVWPVPATR